MFDISYASEEQKKQPPEYSESSAAIKTVSGIEPEEYEVYTTVLVSILSHPELKSYVALEQHTVKKKITEDRLKGIDDFMIEDFNKKNEKEHFLENKFPSCSERDKLCIGVRDPKGKYDALYPLLYGGMKTYISRVGFNKEKTKALVYVEHIPSPKEGFGYIVLLNKVGEKWVIAEKTPECCEEDWIR